MDNKKATTKKQKRLVEETARRLAEIFIMQLEWERNKKREKKNNQNHN
jgi:hypothetical protein